MVGEDDQLEFNANYCSTSKVLRFPPRRKTRADL